MYKEFYEISIWQDAVKLLENIYILSIDFPREEKYALTSQLKRSANSVIANIAESHGRYYFKDKIRVLYISRGEIEETRSHLLIAAKLKYISQEKFNEMNLAYAKLKKDINSYIIDLNNKNKS